MLLKAIIEAVEWGGSRSAANAVGIVREKAAQEEC